MWVSKGMIFGAEVGRKGRVCAQAARRLEAFASPCDDGMIGVRTNFNAPCYRPCRAMAIPPAMGTPLRKGFWPEKTGTPLLASDALYKA